jgi:phosphoglycolate phosphatase
MQFDLVVFDWDGTLMDSEARIVKCLQLAAVDAGLAEPVRHDAKQVIGLGLEEALRQLFPGAERTQLEWLVERYRHYFLGDGLAESELFEGAREVLTELAAGPLLLAVATGKSRRGLDRELERSSLGDCFQRTRCADETFSKPHPQMLLEIMNELGMFPERTLMVGDTEFDVQMAGNAGTVALGVGYGVHEPQRLLDAGAIDCLERITDLPGWLKR